MENKFFQENLLAIKAKLLAGSFIKVNEKLRNEAQTQGLFLAKLIQKDNLYENPWIFIRLSANSRVRMVVVPEEAPFELTQSSYSNELYNIEDVKTGTSVIKNIELEESLFHCPRQLFYSLYEYCSVGCKFCPLPMANTHKGDSLHTMLSHIEKFDYHLIDCIGITSGIPSHLDQSKVSLEMAQVVYELRKIVGADLPIGVSPKQPSKDILRALKDAGTDEVRINLETYDLSLAQRVIPNKDPVVTLQSIHDAVEIFGKGKVSSNIIVGIGETDIHVLTAIRRLSELGAIATLYPYDVVPQIDKELKKFTNVKSGRPSADRLFQLATQHKKILLEYGLSPSDLRTMCPRCGASHLMPGKDF